MSGAECAALRLTEMAGRESGRTLTILTPFDRPVTLEQRAHPRVLRPRRWLHELDRALLEVHPFGSLVATARTAIRLMPYQLEPALAVLRHGATRILIADAVGLGKTIQAGVMLLELLARTASIRALVLVPAGLREQWSSELATHFGVTTIRADAAWLKSIAYERPADVNPWSLPGIYLASHDFVKRPEALRPLETVTWDIVILDEAHAAGAGTDRRAAAHAVACRARRVVLLTATPPAGDQIQLTALCQIGQASGEPGPLLFARSRAEVDAGRERKSVVLPVAPSEVERRMHHLLDGYSIQVWDEARRRNDTRASLASIVLRKRALSSAGSLLSSVQRRMELLAAAQQPETEQLRLPLGDEDPLEDDEPAAALAAPGLADAKRERRWLAAIAEAARVAARDETKIAYLLRLLARVDEPVIVFTEYRDTLARLERRLAATGRSIVVLHGGMSPSERSRIPALFAGGVQTLLATDAAAEGLNLHHRCRIVIHYELPWNPARLEQRAGRVDRLGQTKRVHEIALVATNTAERLVIAPLVARAARRQLTNGSSRLLEILTESAVAEAVLSGVARPMIDSVPDAAPFPDTTSLDVRAEAIREAQRLEQFRRLIARSPLRGSSSRPGGPLVTRLARSRRIAGTRHGLILLYVVGLEMDDGRVVHGEPLVILVPTSGTFDVSETHTQMRARLANVIASAGPRIAAVLADATQQSIEHASTLHHRCHGLLHAREIAIAAFHRSAAQRLVQRGLFERRATEQPSTRLEPAVVDPSPSALRTVTTLVAALQLGRARS